MPVLSRRRKEAISINDDITVTVVDVREDKVQLGVELPQNDCVVRPREVFDLVRRNAPNETASTTVMIPERGLTALAAIRSKIAALPPENGPLIAAILEAVAAKGISAEDLPTFTQKI
ncbi:MAG: carbon storage regulator [Pirellulaceae bacterium]|jgi:carbon storage regulator|nr:carbon storage regulator [Pirellulaceae bacterium]